jgi:hypothetical protein
MRATAAVTLNGTLLLDSSGGTGVNLLPIAPGSGVTRLRAMGLVGEDFTRFVLETRLSDV